MELEAGVLMNSELFNLYVFAFVIAKAALYTGIGPAVLFVYAAEKLVSVFGVPARKQGESWSMWKSQSSKSRKFVTRRIALIAIRWGITRNRRGNSLPSGRKIRPATELSFTSRRTRLARNLHRPQVTIHGWLKSAPKAGSMGQ